MLMFFELELQAMPQEQVAELLVLPSLRTTSTTLG